MQKLELPSLPVPSFISLHEDIVIIDGLKQGTAPVTALFHNAPVIYSE